MPAKGIPCLQYSTGASRKSDLKCDLITNGQADAEPSMNDCGNAKAATPTETETDEFLDEESVVGSAEQLLSERRLRCRCTVGCYVCRCRFCALGQHVRIAISPLIPLPIFAAFRVVAVLWMVGVGILYDWSRHSWEDEPRLVYLTQWGFVAACTYMGIAASSSVALLVDRSADTEQWRQLTALSSAQEGILDSGDSEAEKEGRFLWSEKEGKFMWFASVSFHIAVVLEPCIVIGYWGLVYPDNKTCSFPVCITVHCLGAVLVLLDACLNQLPLLVPRLVYPVGYTALWLASQFAWVYTDHEPDYDVLTLRDGKSAVVAVGGIVLLVLMFFALRYLLGKCRYDHGSCRCIDFLNPYKW